METTDGIDSNFIEGWDRNGLHCWSTHTFDSLSFIEDNSEHICLVDRILGDGRIENLEFRKYINRFGDERFLMFDAESGMDSHFGGSKLSVQITDATFFRKFCDEMLESGEISEDFHETLIESITPPEASELDEPS